MTTETSTARWEHHNETGRRLFGQGKFAEAEQAFRAAITEARANGDESLQLASSLSSIAQIRYQQRDLEHAEELFRHALAMRERLVGGDHASVAQGMNNLAALYVARGELEQAEPLLRRALSIAERQLGPTHPDVAVSLNNLARLLFKQRNHAMAEPLLVRLLAMKQPLGSDHPEVAAVLASLATVRHALGKYPVAEQLWRRVLAIRERSLSASDPAVATTLENLADACSAQGKRDEAVPLRERALAIREQCMPATHPSVVQSRAKLAELRRRSISYTTTPRFVPAAPPMASPVPTHAAYPPEEPSGPKFLPPLPIAPARSATTAQPSPSRQALAPAPFAATRLPSPAREVATDVEPGHRPSGYAPLSHVPDPYLPPSYIAPKYDRVLGRTPRFKLTASAGGALAAVMLGWALMRGRAPEANAASATPAPSAAVGVSTHGPATTQASPPPPATTKITPPAREMLNFPRSRAPRRAVTVPRYQARPAVGPAPAETVPAPPPQHDAQGITLEKVNRALERTKQSTDSELRSIKVQTPTFNEPYRP